MKIANADVGLLPQATIRTLESRDGILAEVSNAQDSTELTGVGKLASQVQSGTTRISELRGSVSAGTYVVNSLKLGEKIIESMIDPLALKGSPE